ALLRVGLEAPVLPVEERDPDAETLEGHDPALGHGLEPGGEPEPLLGPIEAHVHGERLERGSEPEEEAHALRRAHLGTHQLPLAPLPPTPAGEPARGAVARELPLPGPRREVEDEGLPLVQLFAVHRPEVVALEHLGELYVRVGVGLALEDRLDLLLDPPFL